MEESQLIEIINRKGPSGGRKQAAETAKLAGLTHLVEPILVHEWPPLEGRTSTLIFGDENDDMVVVDNLKPTTPAPISNGGAKQSVVAKKADNGASCPEYTIGTLNRAYMVALENPNDQKKVARVAEIATGIVKNDPSKKWILERLASGQWDPFHKAGEKESVEKGPSDFDSTNTPKFLLARVIKQHGAFNGAAAQEHARALNERVKATKYGDYRRGRHH